ncbi:hypothetical protein NECAME_15342 [Necator americanus]|uniref:Uncharacterized protein n=1 Tax=Necator americanus TaxID=51031 RepID=W2SKW4_NECAM|nr:hypothetical protein NECAME_15342 [Necator americanus]ETN69372.1 hypothetical protein NECAME_15342 [Necator americanus]
MFTKEVVPLVLSKSLDIPQLIPPCPTGSRPLLRPDGEPRKCLPHQNNLCVNALPDRLLSIFLIVLVCLAAINAPKPDISPQPLTSYPQAVKYPPPSAKSQEIPPNFLPTDCRECENISVVKRRGFSEEYLVGRWKLNSCKDYEERGEADFQDLVANQPDQLEGKLNRLRRIQKSSGREKNAKSAVPKDEKLQASHLFEFSEP